MKKTSLVVGTMLSAMLCAPLAFGQEAYKCKTASGFVYQDTPCKVVGPTGPAPNTPEERAAIESGKEICRDVAPKSVGWKDPESLRIGDVVPGKVVTIQVEGRNVRARYFSVPVNAKNSYGGYTGEKPLGCYASEDGSRVLKVSTLLMD